VTANAKIVELPPRNLQNIPLMLRRLADDLEAGRTAVPDQVAVIMKGENIEIRAYGDLPTRMTCAGLLHFGLAYLAVAEGISG
jgi:hypothetical protein